MATIRAETSFRSLVFRPSLQDDPQHEVVDHGTQGNGKHLQTEVLEELAEGDFADDDGGQADDDGAATHAHVGRALELRQQAAGKGHQTVGEHQTQDDVGIGVDALSPGHVGVGASGPEGAALAPCRKTSTGR